jgi:hypothetical protein
MNRHGTGLSNIRVVKFEIFYRFYVFYSSLIDLGEVTLMENEMEEISLYKAETCERTQKVMKTRVTYFRTAYVFLLSI